MKVRVIQAIWVARCRADLQHMLLAIAQRDNFKGETKVAYIQALYERNNAVVGMTVSGRTLALYGPSEWYRRTRPVLVAEYGPGGSSLFHHELVELLGEPEEVTTLELAGGEISDADLMDDGAVTPVDEELMRAFGAEE